MKIALKPKFKLSLQEMSERYGTDKVGDCYYYFFLEKYNTSEMSGKQILNYWWLEFGEACLEVSVIQDLKNRKGYENRFKQSQT